MIHAYDQWLLMPVRDLYDTQMMLASIGAAKDMYEKAEKRIEDFKKEYSDFVTPFAKDQAEYNKMMAKVYGVINDAYARGEDPLRSAEGLLTIQQAINQMDPAKVAAMRANAKYGVPYGQSRDELLAKGMYDKGYADYVLSQMGLPSYDDFSTVDDNGNIRMWNMSAAPAYQSMRDFSEPLYKNVKEHDATQADVESFGMTYDPRFKYEKTITRDDLINATRDNILGVENTMRYGYERQRIAQALLQLNNGEAPTEEQLNEAVINYFVNSNLDRLKRPDWDWDKMYTARWSAAHSGGGKGNGGYVPSIFDEAFKTNAILRNNNLDAWSGTYPIMFDPNIPHVYNWIAPAFNGAQINKGSSGYYYNIDIDSAADNIYKNKLGKNEPLGELGIRTLTGGIMTAAGFGDDISGIQFIPHGSIYYEGDGDNGTYWMPGSTIVSYGTGDDATEKIIEETRIPVREQQYSYGSELKKHTYSR